MVAQINHETFAPASHPPEPIASDPDDVRLALETAQAFQAMGDIDEAVEWLERAAERADEAGQRARAIVLVLATAQLANGSAPVPRLASTSTSPPPSHVRDRGFARPPTKLPPCPLPLRAGLSSSPPPARTSSLLPPPPRKSLPPPSRSLSLPPVPMLAPLTSLPGISPSPKGPPRASVPPKRSSGVPAPPCPAPASSRGADALTEHKARANTIRVAIAGLAPGAGPLTIERLDEGQPLPAGTKEATLVLSDDERTIKVVDVMAS